MSDTPLATPATRTETKRGIPLRLLSISLPVTTVAFVCVMAVALWLLASSFAEVRRDLERRQQTLKLTAELSHVADLLARLVRAYAATGETRYLTYYYGLAEYRNGKVAIAAEEPIAYWEDVIAGLRDYVEPREIKGRSFAVRMREAGFSSSELDVLDKVLGISARLEKTEQIAFAATQGLYDPQKNEFVSDGKPNTAFALKLVYAEQYARLQANLTAEIARLAKLADVRTNLGVQQSTERLLQAIVVATTAMTILFALAMAASFFVDKYVLRPIQRFADVASRIATGNYQTRLVPPKAVAELNILGSTVNHMAEAIERDIEHREAVLQQLEAARATAQRLREEAAAHLARIEAELDSARAIQLGMVPDEFPPPTQDKPIAVFATLRPARQVGGDMYDFFYSNNSTLCLVIGDVSDKGAPAALFMAHTSSLMRVVADLLCADRSVIPSPSLILRHVNASLCHGNRAGMFVTLFFGMLDLPTRTLSFCCAGHPMPYVVHADNTVSQLRGPTDLPLGIDPDVEYELGAYTLVSGDDLFLYTDGVTEATNASREFFSDQRLSQALQSLTGGAPKELVEGVVNRVHEFAAGSAQADDIAAMAVRIM